jgi:DNA invertase Pin-like site-specific DNA recombinase
MKKTILYTRLDRREVTDPNESLAGQEKRLREYCEANNLEVVKVIQEINEGKERLEIKRLLQDIVFKKISAEVFLFTSIDKISHDFREVYSVHHILLKYGLTPKAIDPVNFITIIRII